MDETAKQRLMEDAPLMTYYDLDGKTVGIFGMTEDGVWVAHKVDDKWSNLKFTLVYDAAFDRTYFIHCRRRYYIEDFERR